MVSVAKTLGHSGPHLDIALVIMAREIVLNLNLLVFE